MTEYEYYYKRIDDGEICDLDEALLFRPEVLSQYELCRREIPNTPQYSGFSYGCSDPKSKYIISVDGMDEGKRDKLEDELNDGNGDKYIWVIDNPAHIIKIVENKDE